MKMIGQNYWKHSMTSTADIYLSSDSTELQYQLNPVLLTFLYIYFFLLLICKFSGVKNNQWLTTVFLLV